MRRVPDHEHRHRRRNDSRHRPHCPEVVALRKPDVAAPEHRLCRRSRGRKLGTHVAQADARANLLASGAFTPEELGAAKVFHPPTPSEVAGRAKSRVVREARAAEQRRVLALERATTRAVAASLASCASIHAARRSSPPAASSCSAMPPRSRTLRVNRRRR
jgi:hypothetical protein